MLKDEIPIRNRCPQGHDTDLNFSRTILEEKSASDTLEFYCFAYNDTYPASEEQKMTIKKLLEGGWSI